ncbi:MAG: transaldolase family protein [Sphaerochaetaceae bacterium]|nr:transaldolase family protein [Sphaerochaetaceae bacterium]
MSKYLSWMARETKSKWWNDSADFKELEIAISDGAVGVTTNPVLVCRTLYDDPDFWKPYLQGIQPDLSLADRIEEIIRRVTVAVADRMASFYVNNNDGYVCAQVDPSKASDRDAMLAMAKRLHNWAPNIAVKLPVTKAGLDVLEECVAEGITVAATVSFTLPQVLAVARRYEKGIIRCSKAGITPGRCFAVIMVGRIDDYIRDVVRDNDIEGIYETDIIQCGSAIMKRAIALFKKEGYSATLMPAGKRGAYHVTDLSGAGVTFSIHPKIQKLTETVAEPFVERWEEDIDSEVIERLCTCEQFVKAYDADGMKEEEFITYGVVQKTLAQFTENWNKIGQFRID